MTIILCGFKNCGKTTLGKKLAKKTDAVFIDTDDLIIEAHEAKTGQKLEISDVFLSLGEEAFRALEREIIGALKPKGPTVISTGGGAILDDVSVKKLKALGKLVYLAVPKHILVSRLLNRVKNPAFMKGQDPKKAFQAYYKARKGRYLDVADEVLTLHKRSPSKWVTALELIMTADPAAGGK